MMAMGALMHEMGNKVQKIKTVQPLNVIVGQRTHRIVHEVLEGKTTFTREVERGRNHLKKIEKEEPHYFDITPEYGELVELIGGDVRWCCEHKELEKRNELLIKIGFAILRIPLVLMVVGLGLLLWRAGIADGNAVQALFGFVLTWVPFLGWYLYRQINGETPVEHSFNSFFRWAPLFWDVMYRKAREIDAYLSKHPELKKFL
jgi:hypothetical protein